MKAAAAALVLAMSFTPAGAQEGDGQQYDEGPWEGGWTFCDQFPLASICQEPSTTTTVVVASPPAASPEVVEDLLPYTG